MIKNLVWLILGVLIGAVSMYKLSPHQYEAWQPVIEDTRFDYLQDILKPAVPAADSLEKIIRRKAPEAASAATRVQTTCAKLTDYYIPLTEVRQLIFDADRFYYLKEKERALANLRQAIRLMEQLETSRHPQMAEALNALILLVKKVALNLENDAPELNESFRQAGHRVNMMLYKGELILSDEQF